MISDKISIRLYQIRWYQMRWDKIDNMVCSYLISLNHSNVCCFRTLLGITITVYIHALHTMGAWVAQFPSHIIMTYPGDRTNNRFTTQCFGKAREIRMQGSRRIDDARDGRERHLDALNSMLSLPHFSAWKPVHLHDTRIKCTHELDEVRLLWWRGKQTSAK